MTAAEQLRDMAQAATDPTVAARLRALARSLEHQEAELAEAKERAAKAEHAQLMHRCGQAA